MATPLEIVEDLEYLVMNDGGRSQIESFKSRQTEDEEFAYATVVMNGVVFQVRVCRVYSIEAAPELDYDGREEDNGDW